MFSTLHINTPAQAARLCPSLVGIPSFRTISSAISGGGVLRTVSNGTLSAAEDTATILTSLEMAALAGFAINAADLIVVEDLMRKKYASVSTYPTVPETAAKL
jgi:hypothetical protein